jgi:uracil-DNA glycosylase
MATRARPQGEFFGADGLPDNRLDRPLADCFSRVPAAWSDVVLPFAGSETGRALCAHVDARRLSGVDIYPADPLRALSATGPQGVRVVILGQDPYHGPGEAEGLAFSVPDGVRIPPSLRNIHKELAADLGEAATVGRGSLAAWVGQGVLLLNTALTVERDAAGSHARLGWETLSDAIVEAVAWDAGPKVFLLWGAHAQAKAQRIAAAGAGRHHLIASNHPSPLAASRAPVPFLGSRPFSRANAWLSAEGVAPINWSLRA